MRVEDAFQLAIHMLRGLLGINNAVVLSYLLVFFGYQGSALDTIAAPLDSQAAIE
jgi:hypothetical protein